MVGPNIAVAIIAVEVFPKDCPMKRTICAFLMILGVLWAQKSNAFVLVGPMDPAELASGGIDFNYTDDLGGPKELKTFSGGTFRSSPIPLTQASCSTLG